MSRTGSSTSQEVTGGLRPQRVIARRLALGFGLVSLVAVVMCGMLISIIGDVANTVADMREDELAIRESLALATAVREQYMHQAHWIIERDEKHLHHYERWVNDVRRGVEILGPLVPDSKRAHVDRLAEDSQALDVLFQTKILPATRLDDHDAIGRYHREADTISQRATGHADGIAEAVEQRMAGAHTSATEATRLGLISGSMCIFLVLTLAAVFTLRLRTAVIKPLEVVSQAARRFGAGDFETRVGEVGEGELHSVAQAFDHMAEELQAREKRLLQQERMAAIGQLAAGIAHEINNPIQVIRGYLKTMESGSRPEILHEELSILDEEAAACQRLAEDLLAYARAPELRWDSVDMADLLKESARRFAETPQGQDVQVEADTASVLADGGRIRQVLFDLLVNAAQVSKPGSPIEVSGESLQEGGYEIRISDRGPGIPANEREKIFEPFFSKRPGGSGLGLAVCQGIVRAHGGTIDVEDRVGGGSTFCVRIPGTTAGEEATS